MRNSINVYLFSLLMLTACDVTVNNNATIVQSSASPVSKSVIIDAPYEFWTAFDTWINHIRTNGPTYAARTSIYTCTGGGGTNTQGKPNYAPLGEATNHIGFYRDGTVSLEDPSGHVDVMTVEVNTNLADTYLNRKSDGARMYILGAINYPGYPRDTILDAQDRLEYVEIQRYLYPGVDYTMDSGSIWTCSL